jgi:hypothetical protein
MMEKELSELEYEILGSLYFVESFGHILEECKEQPPIVADVLKQLISKKLVVAMKWDDEKTEYVRSFIYDTDDMHAYHYLATKDGLFAHNTK